MACIALRFSVLYQIEDFLSALVVAEASDEDPDCWVESDDKNHASFPGRGVR